MTQKEVMTNVGYTIILDKLKSANTERDQILEEIAIATKLSGELSENSEYFEAKDRYDKNETLIKSLNDKLLRAKVIEVNDIVKDGKIRFGSVVKLIDLDTSNELVYQILGEYEADIKNNIISYKSPIAEAMIGKSVGDQIYFATPKGERELEVLMVDNIE